MVHGRNIIAGTFPYWNTYPGEVIQAYYFLDITILFVVGKCAMSRCFPFPPPGCEREHRPEDLALLKETCLDVKHKEKKQNKEKKDKKRRKNKEKKEKDGSGEKQSDKKDRKGKHKDKKEKHRGKKKDKDLGKDKDKNRILEEPTIAGELEERNAEKLHPKRRSKYSSIADNGKCAAFFQGQNGGMPSPSILPSQATKEAKFVRDLDRRIRDDEKGRWSLFPERAAIVDKRDQEAGPGTAIREPSRIMEEYKSNGRDKRVHIKKTKAQSIDVEITGKAMVANLIGVAKNTNEGTAKPVKEQNDWRLYNREKFKETGDDKRVDKQKDRDKRSHGKDKDKEKEKKIDEKASIKIENKKSEFEKSTNVGTNDLVVVASNKSAKLFKDNNTNLNEGNVRKRKDTDTNGFLHESEIRPNKVQSLALHQSADGRKLEASHISNESSFNKHAVLNNVCLDHQDRLNNDTTETQKPSASKSNSSGTYIVTDLMVVAPRTPHPDLNNVNEALTVPKMKDRIAEEAQRRSPNPDSMYPSQVLIVPKVRNLPGNDDERWLFSNNGPPKQPKLELAVVKEELRVWSEAVHIESADVYALPYVIPY